MIDGGTGKDGRPSWPVVVSSRAAPRPELQEVLCAVERMTIGGRSPQRTR